MMTGPRIVLVPGPASGFGKIEIVTASYNWGLQFEPDYGKFKSNTDLQDIA